MSGIATVSGISPHRIHAMVLRYWYLLMSSWPRLLELVYWPALRKAPFIERFGPSTSGAVMWYASAPMPKPTSSA